MPSFRWWTSVLLNGARALQPFSARRRREGLQVLARRLLQVQDAQQRGDLLWELLQGRADTLTFRRDGVVWNGSVRSVVTRSLFAEGGYQHEEIDHLLRWLAAHFPGWAERRTIINVGANIGDTCVPLALHTDKRLIACEPVPDTFALLRRNVEDNHLGSRIRCRQVAVSAAPGSVTMVLADDQGQNEVKGRDGKQGYSAEHYQRGTVEVPATTLDALAAEDGGRAEDVALVWSDTQGYEREVLESGAGLWRVGAPAWVEIWPAGLNAQGGTGKFVEVCRRHFKHFLVAGHLKEGKAEPSAIDGLSGLVESIGGLDFTDVLLLPS
jgi:FkbM family methyltransferase